MTRDEATKRRAGQFVDILRELVGDLPRDSLILDFGCGAGDIVQALIERGHRACGCDLAFKEGAHVASLLNQGLLREIDASSYRLPYDDESIDVVISDQVFEHVANYASATAEIARVLKPGGLSLHMFPSRLRPIEPHIFVPFGTVIRSRAWLHLWAAMGIRNEFQHNLSVAETVKHNLEYLTHHTHYLSGAQILAAFRARFTDVRACETEMLRYLGDGKYRPILKALGSLFSRTVAAFHTRAIFAAKPRLRPKNTKPV